MSVNQAQVYRENSDFQRIDGLKLMSRLDFHDGMKRVLDIGCGTGYLTSVLAEKVRKTGEVIGIDPDKKRISLANEAYAGSTSNLTFQEGSAEAIPGGGYDVVFSNYVFHWIEDKQLAFRNVFHCLKPLGLFAVCLGITGFSPLFRTYVNLMEPNRVAMLNEVVFHQATAKEIEEMAVLNGFTVQYKEEFNRAVKYRSFDHFALAMYGSFGGLLDTQYMDAEKLEEFKRNVGSGEIEVEVSPMASFIFTKAASGTV